MIEVEFSEILGAFFSLLFVVFSWILVGLMFERYHRHKVRQLLFVGIAWIGISMPWTSDAISFILLITIGQPLDKYTKVIIELAFLPVAVIFWLIVFKDITLKKIKPIILVYLIIGILFEIFLFFALIFDFNLIGTYTPPLGIDYSLIVVLYLVLILLTFIIAGIYIALKSLKAKSEEIRLKGKFLLAAFISFLIATLLEIFLPTIAVGNMIIKIILMSSALEYYIGFILPGFIKNRFLAKEEKSVVM